MKIILNITCFKALQNENYWVGIYKNINLLYCIQNLNIVKLIFSTTPQSILLHGKNVSSIYQVLSSHENDSDITTPKEGKTEYIQC